jgi:hypothetical protein
VGPTDARGVRVGYHVRGSANRVGLSVISLPKMENNGSIMPR